MRAWKIIDPRKYICVYTEKVKISLSDAPCIIPYDEYNN